MKLGELEQFEEGYKKSDTVKNRLKQRENNLWIKEMKNIFMQK